jgi:hypothetical protein
VRHLLFDFEISWCAQALHDEIDLLGSGGIDGQSRMSSHPYGG